MDTLRAWERRYKAVTPARTGRGRLYGDAEIRRLILLRRAVEGGYAIGQVASLGDAELEELVYAVLPSAGGQREESERSALPVLEPAMGSLRHLDSSALNRELDRLALLYNPVEFVHKVALPLMRLAGEHWEKGMLDIAHEHMLSASMRNLLGGLIRLQRAGDGAHRILLTTPAGELHEFGILAAGMLAAAHGFQVDYLGPNLPAREILNACARRVPDAVVLGIMETNVTDAVRNEVNGLAAGLPPAVELWLGGSGARATVDSSPGTNIFVLSDMNDFERHLARLNSSRSKESTR